MTSSRPSSRGKVPLLLALSFIIMMVISIPLGPLSAVTEADPSISRDIRSCPGSEAPPVDQDDGIRYGDWIIDCPWDEPVNITLENVKIKGNITIKQGSVLNMMQGAKIKQLFSSTERFIFDIQESSTLSMVGGSQLDVDTFIARPMSDLIVENSKIHSAGNFNATVDVLRILDSEIVNNGLSGNIGKKGANARLVLDGITSSFHGSVIMSFGGDGGVGDIDIHGGNGGDSFAFINPSSGILLDVIINISGGDGGDGKDSFSGSGSSGGMGGMAHAEIISGPDLDFKIDSTQISVLGGDGGEGGTGSMGQFVPGGDGGRGEIGGNADIFLNGTNMRIIGSVIEAKGGSGGEGGIGGETSDNIGGDGGDAGRGGNTYIDIDDDGDLQLTDSTIQAQGGDGGRGGYYGNGGQSDGYAGNAGGGGSSTVILGLNGNYIGVNSTILTIGGSGGQGGLGAIVAGDGGDGGDTLLEIDAVKTFLHSGPTMGLSQIGTLGGDGGPGGEITGGSGSGGGLNGGRGGDGGDSSTIIKASHSIDLHHTFLRGHQSSGGEGGKTGKDGLVNITMLTSFLNSTDGISEWTLEGFDDDDNGILKNTTVNAPFPAFINEEEERAIVEVWWYLTVQVVEAFKDETWTVNVYEENIDDGIIIKTDEVTGPEDVSIFLLKGATITGKGTSRNCYTVQGKLPATTKETKPFKVCLSENKDLQLKTSKNIYAPTIEVTSPDPNDSIKTDKLPACREPTQDELDRGLLAPGCLIIKGIASEHLLDTEGSIQDVMVILEHEDQGTFVFKNNSNPNVILRDKGSSFTSWQFQWDVGDFNISSYTYTWSAGTWVINVKTFDGKFWSDNALYGGKEVTLEINVIHNPIAIPQPHLDAGSPLSTEYQYDKNGILVTFKDAKVTNSYGVKVIRMEWDYDDDGEADWSYIPSGCGPGEDCSVPETEFFYDKPGFTNAHFCVLTDFGQSVCDDRMINIQRTAPPATFGVPNEYLFVVTLFIICISSVITTALIIASLSEAVKYSIMSFILVPLYTRLKKEEMLDNYTRGEIRGYIVANPGAHYSRIKRDLNLNNGTLIYHLRTLEREGFIYSHRDDYYRRFYPRGRKPRPGPNLTTVQESIIELLLLEPNQTAGRLAKELEKSRKVVNYHLVWLRRWGLVEGKKEGRQKVYSVIYEDDVEMEEDAPDIDAFGDPPIKEP